MYVFPRDAAERDLACTATPNMEYILYPWRPYRVLSAWLGEPRFFSELVTAPPLSSWILMVYTGCVGSKHYGAYHICKQYPLLKCHHKESIDPADCILSLVRNGNPRHFFLATTDFNLTKKVTLSSWQIYGSIEIAKYKTIIDADDSFKTKTISTVLTAMGKLIGSSDLGL
ncbi:UTP23 [Cordylochernes scorpioides]|uniref:UTP23 n=1 Tax=Cordylochernes scorpioides TaxID=51811 RepID=A0ABY6K7M4_9ARAC|nr:UTP23 [Cordylochernes scorpioides]